MKKYDERIKKEILICNCCGQMIIAADESDRASFLSVRQTWGYFSKWDGRTHSFQLCEKCYEKMIESWCYPPDIEDVTELI